MRELLEVSLFETGQDYSFSNIYMTFSDYHVFIQQMQQEGIKYDDGNIVEKYVFKQVDYRLTKKENGFKVYTADLTFWKKSNLPDENISN
ncbi:hypothetical protein COJ27_26040 [Bacillus cereus]|uniref:hypothetical protein n=1 Tax=Bacillus cereus TaxID=1396 RepID=UPI000BF44D5C|nr:hypothetical protein [Bacillus cereus]PFL58910.1 hypothetical protein COJ27_26040 [Bacillus cereus]